MKEMKTASIISVALHAAVLLWALISFSGKALDAPSMESLPVDLVTTDQFSKMMKGVKDAPKKEEPAPLVEKKAEEKAPEQPTPKVTEKKEIAPQPAAPPPAASEPPPDAIAEKLKQEKPKEQAKAEPKPVPPKKPDKPQPKFDADKIAALLDKREATRETATGEQPSQAPSLGVAKGEAARLSQSEIDALRARLKECWNPPVGAANVQLTVIFRVLFKRDGSLAAPPSLVQGPASEFGPVLAETGQRALIQCQPYKMLKPEHYDQWKDMEIAFDPRDMFR